MNKRKEYIEEVDVHLRTAGYLFNSGAKQAAVILKDGSFEVVYEEDYEDVLYLLGKSVDSVVRIA